MTNIPTMLMVILTVTCVLGIGYLAVYRLDKTANQAPTGPAPDGQPSQGE